MTTLNKTTLGKNIMNNPTKKHVWFYFIHGTMRPAYMGTIMNFQTVLNTQNNPYLNQATQKILRSSLNLKSRVPPLGACVSLKNLACNTELCHACWRFEDLKRSISVAQGAATLAS